MRARKLLRGELVIIESILKAVLTALKHVANIGLIIDKAPFIFGMMLDTGYQILAQYPK